MPFTRTDVIARWPALTPATDAKEWATAIADATDHVSDLVYGPKADLLRIHYTGHLIAVSHPELQPPGPVSSESAGGVTVNYAVEAPSTDPDDLRSTPQGRAYLRLRRSFGLIGMAV